MLIRRVWLASTAIPITVTMTLGTILGMIPGTMILGIMVAIGAIAIVDWAGTRVGTLLGSMAMVGAGEATMADGLDIIIIPMVVGMAV